MCLVLSFNDQAAVDALYCGCKFSIDLAKFYVFQAIPDGGVFEVVFGVFEVRVLFCKIC